MTEAKEYFSAASKLAIFAFMRSQPSGYPKKGEEASPPI
jgi:hypothetical protein